MLLALPRLLQVSFLFSLLPQAPSQQSQLWEGIRMKKPQLLLEVEHAIWKLLWSLSANPSRDFSTAIQEMLAHVLSLIPNEPEACLQWFSDGANIEMVILSEFPNSSLYQKFLQLQ